MCQVVQQLLHERITTMIILSHCVGKAGGGGSCLVCPTCRGQPTMFFAKSRDVVPSVCDLTLFQFWNRGIYHLLLINMIVNCTLSSLVKVPHTVL